MKRLRFKKIDAFTGPRSSGNPAGAVYLERPGELSVEQMQRVAAECKGYHLLASGAWSQGRLLIEQNGSHDHPNFVSLALEEDAGERPSLLFGGRAQVKIQGEYLLHEAPPAP